ncbi:hypothetical protein [Mycoplasma sp. P36-A1]|uniref:hypothetical protein n=1 Tax=Mycoplasma sp. P36-A1 TaxID=3252900 RepID=UPI003C2E9906
MDWYQLEEYPKYEYNLYMDIRSIKGKKYIKPNKKDVVQLYVEDELGMFPKYLRRYGVILKDYYNLDVSVRYIRNLKFTLKDLEIYVYDVWKHDKYLGQFLTRDEIKQSLMVGERIFSKSYQNQINNKIYLIKGKWIKACEF